MSAYDVNTVSIMIREPGMGDDTGSHSDHPSAPVGPLQSLRSSINKDPDSTARIEFFAI
jgi:hypothetical protein